MQILTPEEMNQVEAGASFPTTICGVAVGVTVGATFLYSGIGFALTINKALAACAVARFVG